MSERVPLKKWRKVVHISDIHIGCSNQALINELFSFVASYYKDETPKPIVIITGDICDGAPGKTLDDDIKMMYNMQHETAVKVFKEMRELGFEILICPGNHDFPPHGDLHLPRLKNFCDKFFGWFYGIKDSVTYPIVRHIGNYAFVVLNSSEGEFSGTERKFWDGKLGDLQLSRMKNHLEKLIRAGQRTIFVMLHHHPLNAYPMYLLEDGKKMFKIIKEANTNKSNIIVNFGHVHKGPTRFCMKKYNVRTAVYSPSSTTVSNRVKDLNFIEIIPKIKGKNEVMCMMKKVENLDLEKITEDLDVSIIRGENVKLKRGGTWMPSGGKVVKYLTCGCL